jgi:hypothetical protein
VGSSSIIALRKKKIKLADEGNIKICLYPICSNIRVHVDMPNVTTQHLDKKNKATHSFRNETHDMYLELLYKAHDY